MKIYNIYTECLHTFSLNAPDSYIKIKAFMSLDISKHINSFAVLPLLAVYIIFVYVIDLVYIFAVPLVTIDLVWRTHSDNRKILKILCLLTSYVIGMRYHIVCCICIENIK